MFSSIFDTAGKFAIKMKLEQPIPQPVGNSLHCKMESALRGYACPAPAVDTPAMAPVDTEAKSVDTTEADEEAEADAEGAAAVSEARVLRQMNAHFSDLLERSLLTKQNLVVHGISCREDSCRWRQCTRYDQ